MVQNIDFAPTILAITGTAIPSSMQGLSLQPILTGKQKQLARNNLYYHYYEFGKDHTVIPHLGIRSTKHKLIYFYTVNEWEFYDLEKDPSEQKNLITNPAYKATIDRLKKELIKLREQYDDHEPAGELK